MLRYNSSIDKNGLRSQVDLRQDSKERSLHSESFYDDNRRSSLSMLGQISQRQVTNQSSIKQGLIESQIRVQSKPTQNFEVARTNQVSTVQPPSSLIQTVNRANLQSTANSIAYSRRDPALVELLNSDLALSSKNIPTNNFPATSAQGQQAVNPQVHLVSNSDISLGKVDSYNLLRGGIALQAPGHQSLIQRKIEHPSLTPTTRQITVGQQNHSQQPNNFQNLDNGKPILISSFDPAHKTQLRTSHTAGSGQIRTQSISHKPPLNFEMPVRVSENFGAPSNPKYFNKTKSSGNILLSHTGNQQIDFVGQSAGVSSISSALVFSQPSFSTKDINPRSVAEYGTLGRVSESQKFTFHPSTSNLISMNQQQDSNLTNRIYRNSDFSRRGNPAPEARISQHFTGNSDPNPQNQSAFLTLRIF